MIALGPRPPNSRFSVAVTLANRASSITMACLRRPTLRRRIAWPQADPRANYSAVSAPACKPIPEITQSGEKKTCSCTVFARQLRNRRIEYVMKSRVRTVNPPGYKGRAGQMRRSHLAAVTVVPGALLLGWAVAIEALGMSTGLLVGWIPAGGLAAAAGTAAYVIVNLVPQQSRTVAMLGVAMIFNAAYLAAFGWFALMTH